MIKSYKSKILVFLLMLGVLYGCKRQILDPLNSQTHLPQKAQFDKVKGFYEKGRYKNQPKQTSGNQRMTAADSARFKDFEPQWDKTEVELLPNNEKMLIVPVVRYLQVNYGEKTAFIRRLCIRIDENEDLLEANIVDIIGRNSFLPENYKEIFKNYKNTVISGFTGIISIYELDYTLQKASFYADAMFKETTTIEMEVAPPDPNRLSTCVVWVNVWIPGQTNPSTSCSGPNDADGLCGSTEGHFEMSYQFVECFVSDGNNGTPNNGTSNPSTGGQPHSNGNNGTNSNEPSPKDTGVSWELEDDTNQPLIKPIKGDTNTYNAIKIQTDSLFRQTRARITASLPRSLLRYPLGKRADALKDALDIMTRIEKNKSGLELEIIIDPNLVDRATTSYNPTTKRLEIKIGTMPTLSAIPTEEEKDNLRYYIALYAH
ncbi:hypothetical protein, partial [Flavobacterium sp.]|uniref:hypothetical protein n=1 Tax=Flavobacterium sp. TaxID=239 RepID=UPI0038FC78CC